MPLPANLDTDLPLQVVASPFHLGRLSLISFSAYEGYDSNPDLLQPSLQATPTGTEFSAFSGLVVYSFRSQEWTLDLQYEPSVFVSPKLIAKNWTGNGVDAQVERRLSATWSLGVGDHFAYSPNVQSSIQGNQLSANGGGGVAILTPFLSSSRSLLLNTVNSSLTHRISEQSTLVFHADQSFVRLSGVVTQGLSAPVPDENSDSTEGGVSFSHVLGPRDSMELNYDYRAQFSSTTQEGLASFHTASVGWSHEIVPTLRFSISGGPGWSNPGVTGGQWRTTAQGSVEISKESRSGGVALSFNRSDVFAGVVGNNFNNHYALRIDRKFTTHLRMTAAASYIQQQFFGGNDLTGEMGSVELAWFTTRNWSVFGQARYLDTHGTFVSIAPQKVITVGVRWSWVPEKP
jgi:hypothetical protein